MRSDLVYAVVCALVPAAWGLIVYRAFGWLERRRRRVPRDDLPPIDYSI